MDAPSNSGIGLPPAKTLVPALDCHDWEKKARVIVVSSDTGAGRDSCILHGVNPPPLPLLKSAPPLEPVPGPPSPAVVLKDLRPAALVQMEQQRNRDERAGRAPPSSSEDSPARARRQSLHAVAALNLEPVRIPSSSAARLLKCAQQFLSQQPSLRT